MVSRNLRRTTVSLLMLLVLMSPGRAAAQSDDAVHPAKREPEGTIEFFAPPRVLEPEITFLPQAPRIDGVLDPDLESLPRREFSRVWKTDPDNPVAAAHYRLAYGTRFFYVYIETEADRLTYRDRAYQNGDGFSVVIAAPRPDDEPTEEFYVLSCSAVNQPGLEWTRRVFWYYNVDHIFLPTSDETRLEFREGDGEIRFELILPWRDVHPYHPWISEGVGFNLRFVKAIGERDKNEYKVIPGTIGSENSPRWYGRLEFQEPRVEGEQQTFVSTTRGNVQQGEAIRAVAVTAASQPTHERVTVNVDPEGGESSDTIHAEYECAGGVTRHEFEVIPGHWPPDDYTLRWKSEWGTGGGELQVTVLPRFDAAEMKDRLLRCIEILSPGSYTTLEFNIERLGRLLADLPPYEVASYERAVAVRVAELLDESARGQDPHATRTGLFRRSFRSTIDNTLQPYCVRVPDDYDPRKTYPLLVFLHGSASTETDIAGFPFLSPGGVIEMGPFGRGPSNGFATEEAQTDIAEAIDDAIANYPIDTHAILLTGFSMGGYGVYRTFWETPEKFRALAVLSGGPNFGRGSVDFLEEDLGVFRSVPVFIYHGEQDRNVSYERAVQMVERLGAAGAQVEFHSDPDRGHEAPPDDIVAIYHDWLRRVLER